MVVVSFFFYNQQQQQKIYIYTLHINLLLFLSLVLNYVVARIILTTYTTHNVKRMNEYLLSLSLSIFFIFCGYRKYFVSIIMLVGLVVVVVVLLLQLRLLSVNLCSRSSRRSQVE